MKISVKDISVSGTKIEDSILEKVFEQGDNSDWHFIEPLKVKALLKKGYDQITANIEGSCRYKSFCYRCLEDVEKDWSLNVSLKIPIERETQIIDLTEDIRQEVFLHFPNKILCKDSCKGICSGCGVNLNNKDCCCD